MRPGEGFGSRQWTVLKGSYNKEDYEATECWKQNKGNVLGLWWMSFGKASFFFLTSESLIPSDVEDVVVDNWWCK